MAPMKKVPVTGLFSPLMVGYMANILPARAGEFIRAYLLGKKHGIPFSGAFASIVVERLFDIVAVLLLFQLLLFQGFQVSRNEFVFVEICNIFVFGEVFKAFYFGIDS